MIDIRPLILTPLSLLLAAILAFATACENPPVSDFQGDPATPVAETEVASTGSGPEENGRPTPMVPHEKEMAPATVPPATAEASPVVESTPSGPTQETTDLPTPVQPYAEATTVAASESPITSATLCPSPPQEATPTPGPTARPTVDLEARYGENPIHRNVRTGTVEDVQMVLAGNDVNGTTRLGFTPLHFAAWINPDVAIGALLLQAGAEVNANATVGSFDSGWTPLHFAAGQADPSFAELLVDWGADINAATSRGFTPLHRAAMTEGGATTQMLLDRGADVNAAANQELGSMFEFWTPLHHAVRFGGGREVVAVLLDAGADVRAEARPLPSREEHYSRPLSPLGLAVVHADDPAVVEVLLDHGAVIAEEEWEEGKTGLHIASLHGKLGLAQVFLDRGVDVNVRDGGGSTPLHYAQTIETLKFLLDKGGDLSSTDNRGYSLLFGKSCALTAYLLDQGLDVNATGGSDGRTPLHSAALQHSLRRAFKNGLPQLLLDRGADVNARTLDGTTPLHWAVISQFADLAMLNLLLDAGADVNAKNDKGRTPLHEAVAERFPLMADVGRGPDPEMVALLLDRGADVSATDGEGKTACQWAQQHGSFSDHPLLRRLCPA